MQILGYLIIIWVSMSISTANALPLAQAVPGGIVIITLAPHTPTPPHVTLNNQPIMVVPASTPNTWMAIVGIGLKALPGKRTLDIVADEIKSQQFFTIGKKTYPSQHITLTDREKVNPSSAQLERIQQESRRITQAWLQWNPQPPKSLEMRLPVKGRISSEFGLQRYFNGQARNPHSGIDIAAPTGTAIQASAQGTILLTGHFFFNGNTVIIDHGQGLKTLYCHLLDINVTQGQHISVGEIIGHVGQTGRATGPHLHWSVILNGEKVDPHLWLPSSLTS